MRFPDRDSFLLRRLHSLLGVVPLGAFLVEHIITNSFALQGEQAYNDKVAFLGSLPYLYAVEILLIILPIVFHGLLGAWIAFGGQVNTGSQRYFRNWMYVLQRASGLFLLVFISVHIYTIRFSGSENLYQLMAQCFQNPWYVAFYWLGILTATFHFANGLWGFCVTWGITASPRSQMISTWVCAALFAAMSAAGINSIYGFNGGGVRFLNKTASAAVQCVPMDTQTGQTPAPCATLPGQER